VRRGRSRVAFVGLLLVLACSACEVRTDVAVEVQEDGSGFVSVAAGLDADAMRRVPGIAEELRLDDLEATGWEVQPFAEEDDGFTWIRVRKPFATPEEAEQVLSEIAGEHGPMRGFSVTRERSFGRTEYGFAATVDFADGLESFADDELTEILDGEPLGESVPDIEERYGAAIDELFTFRVLVRLPGDVESNAPTRADNGAVWRPTLAEPGPINLSATSELVRWRTYAFVAAAALAVLAAIVVALLGLRKRHGAGHTPSA
jgi:hypothetical protein